MQAAESGSMVKRGPGNAKVNEAKKSGSQASSSAPQSASSESTIEKGAVKATGGGAAVKAPTKTKNHPANRGQASKAEKKQKKKEEEEDLNALLADAAKWALSVNEASSSSSSSSSSSHNKASSKKKSSSKDQEEVFVPCSTRIPANTSQTGSYFLSTGVSGAVLVKWNNKKFVLTIGMGTGVSTMSLQFAQKLGVQLVPMRRRNGNEPIMVDGHNRKDWPVAKTDMLLDFGGNIQDVTFIVFKKDLESQRNLSYARFLWLRHCRSQKDGRFWCLNVSSP
jgi:hypothetical protein